MFSSGSFVRHSVVVLSPVIMILFVKKDFFMKRGGYLKRFLAHNTICFGTF